VAEPKICAATVEQAGVSLPVLHADGLVTRTRDRRHVLYRRIPIADHLIRQRAQPW
jgi:hypothetical protein